MRSRLAAWAATALLALLLAPGPGLLVADEDVVLRVPDGRVLRGTALREEKDALVLETTFGALVVPRELLRAPEQPPREYAPSRQRQEIRTTRSTWILLESDLSEARTRVYHDLLDAFVEWMIGIYELDRERLRRTAPFHMYAWRSRDDFKRVQERVAPAIASLKGKGFAEGVAGFYSPATDELYLWDARDAWGEHPTVALHETAHLLNHRLSSATGIRFPVWFEEGTATYFQTFVPGAKEPEVNLTALATVAEALKAGTPMTSLEIRSVPYATFHGYEYSWGWALVRFLRTHDRGRLWPPLLAHLRTISAGVPTDSENRRFLKAVSYKTSEALDRDWYAHLQSIVPEEGVPLGASSRSLEEVAGLAKPTTKQAELFAELGRSFARSGVPHAAAVYLRAARRGGVEDATLCVLLASVLAEAAGLAEDDPWSPEAMALLRRAVELDPLGARVRMLLGRQMLLHSGSEAEARKALGMLGLALLVMGPDDDDKMIAKWALIAAVEAMPDRSAQEARTWLATRVPEARSALRGAWVYFLQEREEWDLLIEALEGHVTASRATFEERKTLAGLYVASDRPREAATLYEKLLEEDPTALTLWPHYIRALAASGRDADARAAKARALQAADAAEAEHLRRILERIELR